MFCECGSRVGRWFGAFLCRMLKMEKHLFENFSTGTSTCAVKQTRQGRELQSQTVEWPSLLPAQPLLCPAGWLQAEWARRTSRFLATCERRALRLSLIWHQIPPEDGGETDNERSCVWRCLLEFWPHSGLLSSYQQCQWTTVDCTLKSDPSLFYEMPNCRKTEIYCTAINYTLLSMYLWTVF